MEIEVKISSFIPRIREILKDSSAVYYTDIQIANNIVDAFRKMYSRRPSTRIVDWGIVDTSFPQEGLLDYVVKYNDKFQLGIIYFAAARCYESDIKDTVHLQLAAQLKQAADLEFLS